MGENTRPRGSAESGTGGGALRTVEPVSPMGVIEAVLRGAGLSDNPGEYDSDIHSWRCAHPHVYGRCSCFADLVHDLVDAVIDTMTPPPGTGPKDPYWAGAQWAYGQVREAMAAPPAAIRTGPLDSGQHANPVDAGLPVHAKDAPTPGDTDG